MQVNIIVSPPVTLERSLFVSIKIDGMVRVAAATPHVKVADCPYNKNEMAKMIREAAANGASIIAFPELAMTGYTCGDLFKDRKLMESAKACLFDLIEETEDLDILCAVGMPIPSGGALYNCAAVIQKGRILGVVPKSHLPNYGEFYEKRQFASAPEDGGSLSLCGQDGVLFQAGQIFRCKNLPELTLGFEICEDLWVPDSPSVRMAQAGATIIGNLSASNDLIGKDAYRRQLVTMQSAKLLCGYVYASAGEGESTSDVVFGAHQMIAENGTLLGEKRFENGLLISEIDVQRLCYERRRTQVVDSASAPGGIAFSLTPSAAKLTRYVAPQPFVPEGREDRDARCREILLIASLGLKQRLEHTGAKTAVVGLSGGLDSTLAVLITGLAMKMLDRPMTDIVAVTMPCFGTTDRTKNNAVILAERMGATLKTVDISSTVRSHFKDIGHDMEDHSVTFENGQARERTQVLMDIANQTGGIVIGTGDLSELALGWCTYNGDHMSMYAVNTSIPKTLVRTLVDEVGHDMDRNGFPGIKDVIEDIIDTPVSPELLPPNADGTIAQKTEDTVGSYILHDFFLYYTLRYGMEPEEVYDLCKEAVRQSVEASQDGETEAYIFTDEEIKKWQKVFYTRFFRQQFKRNCMPDGVKVGTVSVSPRGDLRLPSEIEFEDFLTFE